MFSVTRNCGESIIWLTDSFRCIIMSSEERGEQHWWSSSEGRGVRAPFPWVSTARRLESACTQTDSQGLNTITYWFSVSFHVDFFLALFNMQSALCMLLEWLRLELWQACLFGWSKKALWWLKKWSEIKEGFVWYGWRCLQNSGRAQYKRKSGFDISGIGGPMLVAHPWQRSFLKSVFVVKVLLKEEWL